MQFISYRFDIPTIVNGDPHRFFARFRAAKFFSPRYYYDLFIRECAALIVAMHEGPEAAPLLTDLATSGSWYASKMLAHLKVWGHINPYA